MIPCVALILKLGLNAGITVVVEVQGCYTENRQHGGDDHDATLHEQEKKGVTGTQEFQLDGGVAQSNRKFVLRF